MPVNILMGPSGSGKTHILYSRIIREAIDNPDKKYILIVPEQSSLQAQKQIVRMHENHGVFNIDVLTFGRLAYRVFEELSIEPGETIDDTGKNLIVRRAMEDVKKELRVIRPSKRQGFISEMKSVISELKQYGIRPDALKAIADNAKGDRFKQKLMDINRVYETFQGYIEGRYVTVEDKPEMLNNVIDRSGLLSNSIIAFDGFTGFTPVQYRLIEKMTMVAERVIFTATMSEDEDYRVIRGEEELFYMSKAMIAKLGAMADRLTTDFEVERLKPDVKESRFAGFPEMDFVERNIFRYGRDTYKGEVNGIHVCNLSMIKDEIRYTASKIAGIVREKGYRYRDIGVITGDMESYGSEIARIFSEAEIPYFMDMKRNLISNPLVDYIRGSIELIVKDFSYESVFRVLKNGLCDVDGEDTDVFENYVLALGIRGYKRYSEKFVRKYPGKTQNLQNINRIRELFINKVSGFVDEMKNGSGKATDYVRAVYNYMEREGLYDKVNRLADSYEDGAKADEIRKSYRQVIELLDRIYALLPDDELTVKEFSEILDAGFEEIKVGIIPPSSDCVVVGDLERSRLSDIKVLFVLGTNEGLIPKIVSSKGILSELERKQLSDMNVELAPTEREKVFTGNYYLYLNLTKPSEELYLLYHSYNREGKEAKPSRIISIFKKMLPSITTVKQDMLGVRDFVVNGVGSMHMASEFIRVDDGDGDYMELLEYLMLHEPYRSSIRYFLNTYIRTLSEDELNVMAASYLYEELKQSSISRIEKYASCAFSHFASYGLELDERKVYELSALDMGNVFHKALELIGARLENEGRTFGDLTEEERESYTEQYVTEATVDYNNSYFNDSSVNAYMRKRITDIVKNTVWALGEQLKAGDFVPWRLESTFSEHYDGVEITGKIDRIDIAQDGNSTHIKIIDYKSGKNNLSFDEIYSGVKLQLMVYLKAVMDKWDGETHAAGVFYNHIDNPIVPIDSEGKYNDKLLLQELCPTGIVGYESIGLLDKDFEKSSAVIPVKTKKDGSVSFNGSVARDEHMKLMADYSVKKMVSMVKEIKDGHIEVNPYKDSCTFCPYRSICGFDGGYRTVEKLNKENIWKAFGWEEKDNGVD